MRKLATGSAAFAAAVYLAHYALPSDYLFWAAVMCLILSCSALLFRGDTRLRITIILICAAAGFAAGGISYAQKTAPCAELSGETLTFAAEVAEYPYITDRFTSVAVIARDDALPRTRVLMYFFEMEAPELTPGDRLEVTAKLSFSGERYGDTWDRQMAEGIYLLCYPEEIEITGKSPFSFLYFPKAIARAVNAAVLKVMPDYAQAFMLALLTGETALLYDDVELYTAMTNTGVVHVVSVSGMHVAFLVGFLRLVLRSKKTASLIGIPAVWVFAAVAGAGAPVIRAAFMQSAVLAAPLIKRESDGLTSLMAILALLLLINPAACASVSLQLSFSAMLGMILITPRVNRSLSNSIRAARRSRIKENDGAESLPDRIKFSSVLAVIATFAATIGALAFSAPLTALYFGSVALFAIPTNILVFWAISACFVLGYISCFLGMLWTPLGVFVGYFAGFLTAYFTAVVEFFGSLPQSRVFVTRGFFLFWLIFIYLIFTIWYLVRRKKSFRPIIPTALALSTLFIGIITLRISAALAPPSFAAVDVGQGQSIVVSSGNAAAVIDCGGKGTVTNAGDTVAAHLLSRGISVVDALCVTHFDDDHINGVIRLMAQVRVKYLFVAPGHESDTGRAEILDFAGKKGVEVIEIETDTEISFGGVSLLVYEPVSRTKPELMILASAGESDILVTGDADTDAEQRLLLTRKLPDVEIFVAGHHGSKYSSSEELLEAISAEIAVISCGYNNYGHPTPEVLARFDAAGMEVLRTDELGTVRIKLQE